MSTQQNEIMMFHLTSGRDVVAEVEQETAGTDESPALWRVRRPCEIREIMTQAGPMPMLVPFLCATGTMPSLESMTFSEDHLFVMPRSTPKALQDRYLQTTSTVQIAGPGDVPKNNSPIITGA